MPRSSSPDLLEDIHTKPHDVRHDTGIIGWPTGTGSLTETAVTAVTHVPLSRPKPGVLTRQKRQRSTTDEGDRAPSIPSRALPFKTASKSVPDFSANATSIVNKSGIWSTFRPGFQVDFGDGYFQWATDRADPNHAVLVQRLEGVDRVLTHERLSRLPHRHFVRFHGLYPAGATTDVVFEYMRLSLVQIIGVPRPLTEQEQRAIVGQVSMARDFSLSKSNPTITACSRSSGGAQCRYLGLRFDVVANMVKLEGRSQDPFVPCSSLLKPPALICSV